MLKKLRLLHGPDYETFKAVCEHTFFISATRGSLGISLLILFLNITVIFIISTQYSGLELGGGGLDQPMIPGTAASHCRASSGDDGSNAKNKFRNLRDGAIARTLPLWCIVTDVLTMDGRSQNEL